MKFTRTIIFISIMGLILSMMTACSVNTSELMESEVSDDAKKEEIIHEKTMTLSIGEKIENSVTNNSIVFNGFPNDKNIAITLRSGHTYNQLFLSIEHPQPLYVKMLKLDLIIEAVDYAKGTIQVKLINHPNPESENEPVKG